MVHVLHSLLELKAGVKLLKFKNPKSRFPNPEIAIFSIPYIEKKKSQNPEVMDIHIVLS